MNTSTTSKPQPFGKTGHSSFAAMSASSLLHDKVNGDRGRATPDSEAMASSEDENDSHHHESAQPVKPPVRRASWLNDPNIGPLSQPGRKNSFASNSMSPTTSHPSTPSAETGTWGSHAPVTTSITSSRGATASSSFPWGQGIWNADSRKEPPSRLSEIPLSPTGPSNNYGGSAFFSGDNNGTTERSIPIEFPLHPTPKTYRSQSYSVGQMDAEANNPTSAVGAPGFPGRSRGLGYSALQHRPSKPSMLSEMTSEGLGKLKEVEDDEEENENNSLGNSTHSLSQMPETASVVEQLMRENAMLRQQQQQNLRLRPKSATINTLTGFGAGNPYGLNDTLPEESDFAIDENDEIGELQDIGNKGLPTRRMSEYEYGANAHARGGFGSLENRKLETLKKAHWQSSLGFGGPSDLPPSRRHSFADVPTRHQSISSIGDPLNGHNDLASSQELPGRFNDADYAVNDHASSYFGGAALQPRNQDAYGMSPHQSAYNSYAMQPQYGGQPSAPHRNMYNVPQPRHNQMLYIVLFKCSRADVFYVQEGTGLSVKPGDLVIVEADRGTDLGTVAQDNVDWATAKELKEQYAEEHYKWLMMYSQGAVGTQDGTGAGLMAASNGLQGSAVGGMGPPTQHGMQEPNPGELKPKIIKRLAQNHEIQALRDKEGNEAKAKRVCMQKVKEHGLHMEILDAEFQMDWKKLTFYYFADAYINFNSLVTDLFKVYKTRIWMSAINPASFASPSLGLQAPSGVGPGAVGNHRQVDRRQQQQQQQQQQDQYNNQRVYGANQYGSAERGSVSPTSFQQPFGGYGFSSFGAPPRTGSGGYGVQQIDPFVAFAPEYSGMVNRFPSPQDQNPSYGRQENGNDQWMNTFQGLSLGTR